MITRSEIEAKVNAGKSISAKQAAKILNANGYETTLETLLGYRDVKPKGSRVVTKRTNVMYWRLEIKKDGVLLRKFDSSMTMHTSYSLSCYILDELI